MERIFLLCVSIDDKRRKHPGHGTPQTQRDRPLVMVVERTWRERLDSSPPPIISDVGLEGDDVGPINDVGLEAPISDVRLEGGGEEEGEAGGDMFLRMAV